MVRNNLIKLTFSPVVSSTDQVIIKFQTDKSVQLGGFRMHYAQDGTVSSLQFTSTYNKIRSKKYVLHFVMFNCVFVMKFSKSDVPILSQRELFLSEVNKTEANDVSKNE